MAEVETCIFDGGDSRTAPGSSASSVPLSMLPDDIKNLSTSSNIVADLQKRLSQITGQTENNLEAIETMWKDHYFKQKDEHEDEEAKQPTYIYVYIVMAEYR